MMEDRYNFLLQTVEECVPGCNVRSSYDLRHPGQKCVPANVSANQPPSCRGRYNLGLLLLFIIFVLVIILINMLLFFIFSINIFMIVVFVLMKFFFCRATRQANCCEIARSNFTHTDIAVAIGPLIDVDTSTDYVILQQYHLMTSRAGKRASVSKANKVLSLLPEQRSMASVVSLIVEQLNWADVTFLSQGILSRDVFATVAQSTKNCRISGSSYSSN